MPTSGCSDVCDPVGLTIADKGGDLANSEVHRLTYLSRRSVLDSSNAHNATRAYTCLRLKSLLPGNNTCQSPE